MADEGYFGPTWLKERFHGKRYFFDRVGKRLHLQDVLPPRLRQSVQLRVLVGAQVRLPARLLLVRVPKQGADQRREHLHETANKPRAHQG